MKKELKYILFFLLLNLLAACLFKAQAQTDELYIVEPNTRFQISGYDYMCWEPNPNNEPYRMVLLSHKNEIVNDICCISRIYVSVYSRTVVIETPAIGTYKLKMPPAGRIVVLTTRKPENKN